MITTTKKIENINNNIVPNVYFLTLNGETNNESPVLNNNSCYVSKLDHDKYGKIEDFGNIKQYYLKQYRGGRPGELLVDPYGVFSKAEDLSAFISQRGHRFCEYIKVTEKIYATYVAYLRSRDSRYFRACEKEILDKVI